VTPEDVGVWLDACIDHVVGRLEGPAVLLACDAFRGGDSEAIRRLDAEVHALRPSSAARQASRSMGGRLIKMWERLYPDPRIDPLVQRGAALTLPVAFGVACASAGIADRTALEGFSYTRCAAVVSSAMRLLPLGQHDAHRMLAAALARVPALVDAILTRRPLPQAFTPALDLVSMKHRFVHSRLFQS
jgi:urease accessory protein